MVEPQFNLSVDSEDSDLKTGLKLSVHLRCTQGPFLGSLKAVQF